MIALTKVLSHLPGPKIKELETITERIVETGMVAMVMLYGSYARGDWKEMAGKNEWFFNPDFRTGKKSDYDLLVLTKDERDCKDVKHRISRMFVHAPTAVQVTVETLGFVNMHLREGQYFFTEIKEQGIILYAENSLGLATPEHLTAIRIREIAEQDFKQWFEQAQVNFRNSEMNRLEAEQTNNAKFLQKASFELQQCVENCYTAIEMVFSRNNPYEHRLIVLRMNATRYVPEIDRCFPQHTAKERNLFFHLDAAYIGGRYIDEKHYKVTKAQLDHWEKEAGKLLEITEKACQKKIEELKAKERKHQ
ncbi:MAG: nucleotidyltransferase domain-containing protein [Bacteroidota bacterium]